VRAAVIVATEHEAELLRPLGLHVHVSGIGPVSAALTTQEVIWSDHPDLLVSAGIGGAYPGSGLAPGDVVIASEMIYAGLGARDGDAFLDLEALGFPLLPGTFNRFPAWEGARAWAERAGAAYGPVLTLETVTGDAATAAALTARHPGALAEGMEGAGVAHAARRAGLPAVEVRGVSNAVGPRDRAAWRIPEALKAVRNALRQLPKPGTP